MEKLVNTTALMAAMAAVCFALWRDYGVLATVKRAAIAYFAFYGIGSLLALVFRAGIQDDWIREDWARYQQAQKKHDEKRTSDEVERQAEKERRKVERKKQLVGEDTNAA